MFAKKVFEDDSQLEHYQVVDTNYEGRPARVLYSGQSSAPQSGVAQDGNPKMLFDYNRRFMELARGLRPRRVLVIGGGAFTLPVALIDSSTSVHVDVVERDPFLSGLARRFFRLPKQSRLNIINRDGYDFLGQTKTDYDLIVIDAFVGFELPGKLLSASAARLLKARLTPRGLLAANLISPREGTGNRLLRQAKRAYQGSFKFVAAFPADADLSAKTEQNLILTASQHDLRPADYLN